MKKTVLEEVYTPHNSLKNPVKLFRQMFSDLVLSFQPALRLTIRDIRAEYRQSILGIFWSILAPVIASFTFILANNAKIINVGNVGLPYPAYVMFSMTLWEVFLACFQAPINAMHQQGHMMTRMKFRFEAAVLNHIFDFFYNLLFKFALIVGLFVIFKIQLHWTILLAPFAFIVMILFSLAFGFILTPISILYKDVGRLLQVFISFLLFATPVVYAVPETGMLSWLMKINPVTYLLMTIRELSAVGTVSYPLEFIVVALISILVFPFAWLFLRLSVPYLVERMMQ